MFQTVPVAIALALLDFFKVEGVYDAFGGVQSAQLFADSAVDLLLIDHCGFPAHSTKKAKSPHGAESVVKQGSLYGCGKE